MREERKKEVKIKDLNEHISLLKQDLSIVNEELENRIKSRDLIKLEISELNNKKYIESENLRSLLVRNEFIDRAINSKLIVLSDLDSVICRLSEKVNALEANLENKENQVVDKQELLNELDEIEKLKIESLESIDGLLKQEDSKVKELSQAQLEMLESLFRADEELDSIKEEGKKTKEELLKEAEEIEGKIKSEREKISGPMRLVREREDAMARRERNFMIIYNRLQKIYSKQFPGLILKI